MYSLIPVVCAQDITALVRALPGSVAQGLIWGIMAIGVFLTFKILDFADLTVDGTMATGGVVTVMLILKGWNPLAAVAVAFVAGMLAGLITGILHTVLGIPDILAGILTQLSLYSINLNISEGKANQAVNVDMYKLVVSGRDNPAAIVTVVIILLVVIALMYWFFGTELGFTIRATGCNPNMSRAQGINTNVAKVLALVFSNGLVGFAGGLLSQYQGNFDVNMGRGSIVIGLASVIIGEVLGEAIFGKKLNFSGRLAFVAVGSIIYYIVIQFVLWLGLPTIDMKMFSAMVVAIFLAVPYLRGKAKNSYRKAAKGGAGKC
ncbi:MULTISPECIES: ABC transporter permease [Clostridia]|jgi:putative tryptophan/tyrosine transport system permease protein|uniref:ABC transporter permease n=1 Tax=Butyribacter intestini TaxID=1703332 RepID=A0AAW3JSE1_9FIRM|nr:MULTISPECIES: ABC transporter permease [Clostridia]KQC85206.1 ABC transporter permease [Butyribacter intestini]RHP26110.1 ABC transporter permease [Clostridium sp. AF34-13]RHU74486.1 ABC transporter permease [Butyribacter intestini]